jgi:hypothetical protein
MHRRARGRLALLIEDTSAYGACRGHADGRFTKNLICREKQKSALSVLLVPKTARCYANPIRSRGEILENELAVFLCCDRRDRTRCDVRQRQRDLGAGDRFVRIHTDDGAFDAPRRQRRYLGQDKVSKNQDCCEDGFHDFSLESA